jgi:hypothetical protein
MSNGNDKTAIITGGSRRLNHVEMGPVPAEPRMAVPMDVRPKRVCFKEVVQ